MCNLSRSSKQWLSDLIKEQSERQRFASSSWRYFPDFDRKRVAESRRIAAQKLETIWEKHLIPQLKQGLAVYIPVNF